MILICPHDEYLSFCLILALPVTNICLAMKIALIALLTVIIQPQVGFTLMTPPPTISPPSCPYGVTVTPEGMEKCLKGPGHMCGGRYGYCADGLTCSIYGICEGCSFITFSCWYNESSYHINF